MATYSSDMLHPMSTLQQLNSAVNNRRSRFWHATQDCVAPYVNNAVNNESDKCTFEVVATRAQKLLSLATRKAAMPSTFKNT